MTVVHQHFFPWKYFIVFTLVIVFQVLLSSAIVYKIPLMTSPYLTREDVEGVGTSLARQEKDLHGRPGQGYYMQLEIGEPPQQVRIDI